MEWSKHKKKKYQKNRLKIPTREKAEGFHAYLTLSHPSTAQQFGIEDLETIFKNQALKHNDLEKIYMDYTRSQRLMPQQVSGPQRRSHDLDDDRTPVRVRGDLGSQPEFWSLSPHGTRAVEPGSYPRGGKNKESDYIPSATGDGAEEKMQNMTIQWIDPKSNDTTLGSFFVNKLWKDESKSSWWEPSHLSTTPLTCLLTVVELYGVDDLQEVVLVQDHWLQDSLQYSSFFPASAQITIVCPTKEESGMLMQRKLLECREHRKDYMIYDDYGELKDVGCNCSAVQSIAVIHPRRSQDLRCNISILRYTTRVRVIVSCSHFSVDAWDRLAQFGWYCDLPIQWSQSSEHNHQGDFGDGLLGFLECLGVPEGILACADFTVLSPAVHSICTVSDHFDKQKCREFGMYKLAELSHNIHWPEVSPHALICQSNTIGAADIISTFSNATGVWKNPKHIYLIYPSKNYISANLERCHWDRSEMNGYVQNCFKYADTQLQFIPFLNNLGEVEEDDPALFSTANVYTQFETQSNGKQFGWILAGSQRLSNNSWKDWSRQGKTQFHRYEFAVAIFPYKQIVDGGLVTHAVDLSLVGCHFSSKTISPYADTDIPFLTTSSSWRRPLDKLYHCIGRLERVFRDKPFAFVSALPSSHPMNRSEIDDFPEKCSDAFLSVDVLHNKGYRQWFEVGTCIEFLGFLHKNQRFRINHIINVTENTARSNTQEKQRLTDARKIEKTDFGMADMFAERRSSLDENREKTFEEEIAALGLSTEKEVDDYMRKWFSGPEMMNRGNFWVKSTDAMPPMASTKIKDDGTWLYEHILAVCHGQLPNKMQGPLLEPNLHLSLMANRKESFVNTSKVV